MTRARLTNGLIAVNVTVFVGSAIYGVHGSLLAVYAFSRSALLQYDIAAILVSGFLHTGIAHLLYNMLFLFLFGRAAEDEFGWWRLLALYIAGMIGGSLFFAALFPGKTAVGASGAIFGIMAAIMLVEPGKPILEDLPLPVGLLGVAYLIPAVANAFSLANNTANIAHVGGAVTGALLAFLWEPERARHGVWAVIGFALLIAALGF